MDSARVIARSWESDQTSPKLGKRICPLTQSHVPKKDWNNDSKPVSPSHSRLQTRKTLLIELEKQILLFLTGAIQGVFLTWTFFFPYVKVFFKIANFHDKSFFLLQFFLNHKLFNKKVFSKKIFLGIFIFQMKLPKFKWKHNKSEQKKQKAIDNSDDLQYVARAFWIKHCWTMDNQKCVIVYFEFYNFIYNFNYIFFFILHFQKA